MKNIVVAAPADRAPRPISNENRPTSTSWAFSFIYWKQIENFGLTHVPKEWFIDFLDGLKQTAAHLEQLVEGNPQLRSDFHFHEVKWTKAKVKIRRRDLNWLPTDIQANEAEFPMHQLSLGKGPMRVVGFWSNDTRVFYVVLVDPHHNIHTSEGFEGGQYCADQLGAHHQLVSALQEFVDRLRSEETCVKTGCLMHSHALRLFEAFSIKGQIYVEPDILHEAVQLVHSGNAKNIGDIIAEGVLSIQAKSPRPDNATSLTSKIR